MKFGFIAIATCLIPGLAGGPAFAGFIPTHAFAMAYDGQIGPCHYQTEIGERSASAGLVDYRTTDNLGLATSSAAIASASGGDAGALIRASTAAYGRDAGLFSPIVGAFAVGAWRDIIYAPTGLAQSEVLRLTFNVSASLYARANQRDYPDFEEPLRGFPTNLAEVSVRWSVGDVTNALDLSSPNRNGYPLRASIYDGNQGQGEHGPKSSQQWDTYLLQDGNFVGTFHVDVPYTQLYGGYGWSVALLSSSIASGGAAHTDVSHTLGLQSVTLTDGTPLEVTFDSGLQLSPTVSSVPAPPAFVLLVSGLLPLSLWRLRRCRTAVTA